MPQSPAYVQQQLGHASIQLTMDTYGKRLPLGNKAAMNQLDEESGCKKDDGHPGPKCPSTMVGRHGLEPRTR